MRRPSTSSRHRSITLPRFILVGATTLPGWLSEPFRDRFELPLSLEYYSDE
jgi:Holliday junction DNA helicase RuvB